jgi:Tfp pilus assembly protein PilF
MNRTQFLAAALCVAILAPPVSAQQGDGETHFTAGTMHLREGRVPMAIDAFKKAIKADPKNAYAYKALGIAYMSSRDYPHAIEALRKALELNEFYVDVRNDLGTALILSGKRAEGKAEYVTALNDATNPTPEVTARNLGQAYLEEHNYVEAANWFQASVNRNKNYPDAYLGLADALFAQGRVEDVIRHLEVAAKEVPGNACILGVLGDAQFRAGRFTEARARLEEAARRDTSGNCGRRAQEQLKSLPR